MWEFSVCVNNDGGKVCGFFLFVWHKQPFSRLVFYLLLVSASRLLGLLPLEKFVMFFHIYSTACFTSHPPAALARSLARSTQDEDEAAAAAAAARNNSADYGDGDGDDEYAGDDQTWEDQLAMEEAQQPSWSMQVMSGLPMCRV